MTEVLINGEQATHIAVMDRGLHYGDGLFETIAVINGEPRFWKKHYNRLMTGCRRLRLQIPGEMDLLTDINKLGRVKERTVIKIILTRGWSQRGYPIPPSNENRLTRIVISSEWKDSPSSYVCNGVNVKLCETQMGLNPKLAGIKHLNRLEQVLASSEWSDPSIAEGLMQDINGYIIEGTRTNLFIISSNNLLTPLLTRCGVAGVMRELIMEISVQAGIPVQQCDLTADDIYMADEVFLCNSLIGIWPVRQVENATYPVGNMTKTLIHLVNDRFNASLNSCVKSPIMG